MNARKGTYYFSNPDLATVGRTDQATFMLPGGDPFTLSPCDPGRVSAALRALRTPLDLAEVERLLDLRELFLLVAHGFVLAGDDPTKLLATRGVAITKARRCKHLVFGVTGAIGALYAAPLVLELARHFAERVDVVLTESARKLVQPEVFAYLGLEAWTDAFAPRGTVNVPHIFLSRADLVVIAPASAQTIHKLATGACSDLLSLVCAATKAPVLLAPSMNAAMWDNPAIAHNVAILRSRGLYVVEPTIGFEVSDKANGSWEFGPASMHPGTWGRILGSVLEPAPAGPGPRAPRSGSPALRAPRGGPRARG
jgi:hypothetical protein